VKFKVRVVGVVVGIALVAACGSTKTVAVPGPTVFVTPTPTETSAPVVPSVAPGAQKDVAPQVELPQVPLDTSYKGKLHAYALAFADSGAVNLRHEPTVSSNIFGQFLVGTFITVACSERSSLIVNDVGRSSDEWYFVTLGEGMDGFISSVFVDFATGDTSWVVPVCPAGTGG
jgi:hypothetical protein